MHVDHFLRNQPHQIPSHVVLAISLKDEPTDQFLFVSRHFWHSQTKKQAIRKWQKWGDAYILLPISQALLEEWWDSVSWVTSAEEQGHEQLLLPSGETSSSGLGDSSGLVSFRKMAEAFLEAHIPLEESLVLTMAALLHRAKLLPQSLSLSLYAASKARLGEKFPNRNNS